MENLFGYFAAALIGVSLGLIGGGGSILTVPVLVYLFHIEPTLATAYSLFIVGTTSAVGGIKSSMKGLVDFRTAIVFAVPSFIAVYLTRRFIVPMIPAELVSFDSVVITKDIAIMVFFGMIMLAAAISMIRQKANEPEEDTPVIYNYPLIILEGIVVGMLTGIVGAGGGFLIIPALVLFARLPMKKAVGTSLVIIAAKSLVGFLGDIGSGQLIDFRFIIIVSVIAIAGIFLGTYISKFIGSSKLKRGFGWFVLAMSVYVIANEIWL
jgi:uncharacterized membrane protein YfcA